MTLRNPRLGKAPHIAVSPRPELVLRHRALPPIARAASRKNVVDAVRSTSADRQAMVRLEFSNRTAISTGSPVLDDEGPPFGRRERGTGNAPPMIAGTPPSLHLLGIAAGPTPKAAEDLCGILCVLATSVRPSLFAARLGYCPALAQYAQSVPSVPRSGVLSKTISVGRLGTSSRLSALLRRASRPDTSSPVHSVVLEPFVAPSLSSLFGGTTLFRIASEPLSFALLGKCLGIGSQHCHASRCRSAASSAVTFCVVSVVSNPGASTRFGRSLLLLAQLSWRAQYLPVSHVCSNPAIVSPARSATERNAYWSCLR